MTWTPIVARHRADKPADSGASARPVAYRDVWAGNPDTDKHWNKGD